MSAARLAGSVLLVALALPACDAIQSLIGSGGPGGNGDGSGDGSGGAVGHQVSLLPETEPKDAREQAMRLPAGRPVLAAWQNRRVIRYLTPGRVL